MQQRYARFGLKIFSGVHAAYRSTKVQLGLPGRDKDIETYCRFLRDIGSFNLGVPGQGNPLGNNIGADEKAARPESLMHTLQSMPSGQRLFPRGA